MSTVRFYITKDDAVAFSEHHAQHSPLIRRQMLRAKYLYSLFFMVLGFSFWLVTREIVFSAGFALMAIVWVFWWPWYWKRRYRKQVSALYEEGTNKSEFGEREIEANSEGIFISAASGEQSKFPWRTIERVERDQDYLYIYQSAVSAIVVPKQRVRSGNFEELARICTERAPTRHVKGQGLLS